MRISFDLDGTLILKGEESMVEPGLPPFLRAGIEEWLRAGTKDLMIQLQGRGCEIWIYTNSWRGRTDLMVWFSRCGLPVSDVINQQLHDLKRSESDHSAVGPAKFPPLFGIDLHVDDSVELESDAERLEFPVVRVDPGNPEWTLQVLEAVDRVIERRKTEALRKSVVPIQPPDSRAFGQIKSNQIKAVKV